MIKGSSGYGPVDEAYNDKFVFTAEGMSYEYKPYIESDFNQARKWSFKTNNPLFKMAFERVTNMMPGILDAEETFFCTDVGMIDFTVTFDDKTKKHIRYWCTPDVFSECFSVIRKLIPTSEMPPEVLRSYDEDAE